jgi:succinoglycan biosynthesis protein ExoA
MLKSEFPAISVIIPAWNEAGYIAGVIAVFQQTAYPNILEILVADGGSTDGTQEIVQAISGSDPRVRLLHNTDRIQSAALNLMITEARGEVILRADAHCEYDDDYVEACIGALRSSGSVSVGGAQRFVATNAVQAGTSLIVRTVLGSGNARYRRHNYNGYAETVFLGCYLKQVFDEVGLFSTEVHPNEDTEMNIRILKKWPNGVYISSTIRTWYFPRSTFKGLWNQYFAYGRARVKTRARHKRMAGLRASVPFLFLMGILTLWAIEPALLDSSRYGKGILVGLGAVFLGTAGWITWSTRRVFAREIWRSPEPPPGMFTRFTYAFLSGILMNLAHAVGYAVQFFSGRR